MNLNIKKLLTQLFLKYLMNYHFNFHKDWIRLTTIILYKYFSAL